MKKLVGETTRFVYGIGGELVAEFDSSTGNLKKEYISGGIAVEPTAVNSNGTQYPTTDHLGSPRVITNSSANVVSRHDYMPLGEELGAGVGGRTTGMGFSASGDNNRKKFTGYERDTESGLDFAQARYYANMQGRFTSPDPLSSSAKVVDPQSWNRYTYCFNNPVALTDPTGLEAPRDPDNKWNAWRKDEWSDGEALIGTDGIDRSYAEVEGYAINGLAATSENGVLTGTVTDPQNPQSQEEFEAGPEYHQLLVSYTNSITNAIPGATVQWNADTGKIQYIDFPGTYEETIAALDKAGYFSGLRNWAWNPKDHAGGKEFRDPLSVQCELSFHFAVLYPQYEQRQNGWTTVHDYPKLETVRLPGPTRAVDVHIDRASPIHPGSGWTHFGDFWRNLERQYGFR